MSDLRNAGDFPNKAVVEYATIKVEIPHSLVPQNLQNPHYDDQDIVQGLYVSPSGRLTYKTLYLDNEDLAKRYVEKLHVIFRKRPYRDQYKLAVTVEKTTMTVTATKGKIKHSALVADDLAEK